MITLQDFTMELVKIRKALDTIEVKGLKNASLLCFLCERCDKMLDEIKKVSEELSENGTENQNDSKEGDVNAS